MSDTSRHVKPAQARCVPDRCVPYCVHVAHTRHRQNRGDRSSTSHPRCRVARPRTVFTTHETLTTRIGWSMDELNMNKQKYELFSCELSDTQENIRSVSILELFRSYAIGGIVAITGSGAVRSLNYPGWKDFAIALADGAIEYFNEKTDHRAKTNNTGLAELYEHGKKIINQARKDLQNEKNDFHEIDSISIIYSLCERELNLHKKEKMEKHNRRADDDKNLLYGRIRKIYEDLFSPIYAVHRNVPRDSIYTYKINNENRYGSILEHESNSDLQITRQPEAGEQLKTPRPIIDIHTTLIADWRIRRFATLNYDQEIELSLENFDFQVQSLSSGARSAFARLGIPGRSIDISHDNLSQLISFSANYPTAEYNVLHLHGTYTQARRVVASHQHYTNRYVIDPDEHALLDAATDLLYQGNAVVMIGVGMTEEDVLRRLRYLSAHGSISPASVFCFLPGSGNDNSDTLQAITISQKFGIRTIFYGTKLGNDTDESYLQSFDQHPLVKRLASKTAEPVQPTQLAGMHKELAELETIRTTNETIGKTNHIRKLIETVEKNPIELPRLSTLYEIGPILQALLNNANGGDNHLVTAKCQKLEHLIRTRALHDSLEFFVTEAKAWKQRWSKQPEPVDFRSMIVHGENYVRTARNLCLGNDDHYQLDFKNADSADLKKLESYLRKINTNTVFIGSNGCGKGTICTAWQSIVLNTNNLKSGTIHHFYSFDNSIDFHSPFDYLRSITSVTNASDKRPHVIILQQPEILFDEDSGLPRLTEWDLIFRNLTSTNIKAEEASKTKKLSHSLKFVVFTSSKHVADYFSEICGFSPIWIQDESDFVDFLKSVDPLKADDKTNFITSQMDRIIHSAYSHEIKDNIDAFIADLKFSMATTYPGRESFGIIEEIIEHAQLDSLNTHIDSDVDRSHEKTFLKIYRHLILKHLFAVSVPCTSATLAKCAEFDQVAEFYKIKPAVRKSYIEQALKQLSEWKIISRMYTHISWNKTQIKHRDYYYGLHKGLRHYLSVKQKLPFAYVQAREHCSLSLVQMDSERGVRLERRTVDFVIETIDSLLKPKGAGSSEPRADDVRTAFSLMRGTLRLSSILASDIKLDSNKSLLDTYFTLLMKFRTTLLDNLGGNGTSKAIYHREWVWLFNEAASVRYIQGNIHDAVMLYEQALKFENMRYLHDIKPRHEHVCPSRTSYIRITLNLCACLIERGALTAVIKKCRTTLQELIEIDSHYIQFNNTNSTNSGINFQPGNQNHPELRKLLFIANTYMARANLLMANVDRTSHSLATNEAQEANRDHDPTLSAWNNRIRADMAKLTGDMGQAEMYIMKAVAEASASGLLSLEIDTKLSQLEILGTRENPTVDTFNELDRMEKECLRLGLSKSYCSCLITRSIAEHNIGAIKAAQDTLFKALALASSCGLRLKRIESLRRLSDVLIRHGSNERIVRQGEELKDIAMHESDRIHLRIEHLHRH